tara:strand:- start:2428 stop:3843 length:1416 start_codon:yes stop_codon:yes gene_type:complete
MADANRVQVSTLEEKTWGTTNAAVGSILVNGAVAVGDTTVSVDGDDSTALTVGDTFTVAGDTQVYIVKVDGGATITFSPAAKATWADDAAITTNNFVELPITGGSMSESPDTVRSSQLRSDAQLADMKRTGVEPTAAFDFEMQADNIDNILRAALRNSPANTWSHFQKTAATDTVTIATGKTYTAAAGFFGADDAAANAAIPKGSWIYISGCSDATNNGWKQVSKTTAVTATVLTVEQTCVAGSNQEPTFTSSQIRNGSDLTSFSLQMANLDIASTFRLITGARITDFGLNISSQSIITGNVGFSGKRMTRPTSASGAGSVTTAADVDVMSEVTAFDGFWIGGSEITTYEMVSASLNIATAARPQVGLGNLQKVGMNLGPIDVTGSVEFYLESANYATLQDYLLNFTSFEFGFALSDGTNRYFFHMPQVKLTSEPGTVGGIDTDMMLSFDFAADPADIGGVTKTIQVSRVS